MAAASAASNTLQSPPALFLPASVHEVSPRDADRPTFVMDSEDRFFLREAVVVSDILRSLASDTDNGFDDVLFVKCQAFLAAHSPGLDARRSSRARALRELQKDNTTTATSSRFSFLSRWAYALEHPSASTMGYASFVLMVVLVLTSVLSTVVATLPSYNPTVQPEYVAPWNALDLTLGALFTIEIAIRLVSAVRDDSLPTSGFQNGYRFLTKGSNLIDMVSVLPTYVQLFVPASSRVITGTLRTIRLLRLFKILRFYKPVRILQKALRFAWKGLVAPLLFIGATLIFISAAVYYMEDGFFDPSIDTFLIQPDPICPFEPSSFMSLSERMPQGDALRNCSSSSTAPSRSSATSSSSSTWYTLPPMYGSSSASSAVDGPSYGGGSTLHSAYSGASTSSANGNGDVDPICQLECPLAPAEFISIPQSSWWAIATMSTCGFGDFITVTAAGRILAVFGILAGILLNAMPIAVIDSSFVTTLQTEEDLKSRETHRKRALAGSTKHRPPSGEADMNASVSVLSGEGPQDNHSNETPLMTGTTPPLSPRDDRGGGGVSDASLATALLYQSSPSLLTQPVNVGLGGGHRSTSRPPVLRTHTEAFLLQLHRLSKLDVLDLANPSDAVLNLVDYLLESAVTNVAHEIAQARSSRDSQKGNPWHLRGVARSGCLQTVACWSPKPMNELPLWTLTATTNVLREAQLHSVTSQQPTGDAREVVEELTILTCPTRCCLSSFLQAMLPWKGCGDSSAIIELPVLDASLLALLREKRSDAIAREAMLLMSGRSRGNGAQSGLSGGSAQQLPPPSDDDDDDDGGWSDVAGAPGVSGRRNPTVGGGPPNQSGSSGSTAARPQAPQQMDLNHVLARHCDITLATSWGSTQAWLTPRTTAPSLFTLSGEELEVLNVQVLRYHAGKRRWLPIIPFRVPSSNILDAPLTSAKKFWRRTNSPKHVPASTSSQLVTSVEAHVAPKGITLTSVALAKQANALVRQLRHRSHYDAADERELELQSRKSYRQLRAEKEREEAKRQRSAKWKKEAETRDLLEALSSEKREAFAVLQTLGLDVSGVALSDRLSLLALATTAAEKLEKQRVAEFKLAVQRFSSARRIIAEEQHPRYLLESGDVILVFGGSTSCPREITRSIARALPSPNNIAAFVQHRTREEAPDVVGGGESRKQRAHEAKAGAVWDALDALSPLLVQTLAYVYTAP